MALRGFRVRRGREDKGVNVQASQHVQAVPVRQIDIDQDQVRAVGLYGAERGLAAAHGIKRRKSRRGVLYPAASVYMSCDFVQKNPKTVQKVANAFVGALQFINTHSAAEIAAKMPKEYANAGADLYEKSINDTKTMFNKDGKMDPEGAKNVLKVLDSYSANVKGKGATVDLSKTYTTEFVDKVPAP